jgi:hypothetical protein
VRRFLDGAQRPRKAHAFADSSASAPFPHERVEDLLFEVHQDIEIGIMLSGEIGVARPAEVTPAAPGRCGSPV